MSQLYNVLPYSYLPSGTHIRTAVQQIPGILHLSDPAIKAMTDLAFTPAFCISPRSTILEANEKMIHCGVRLLFVSETQGAIYGLITATDILGERPVRYISEHAGSRDEILVQDIMTPLGEIDALQFAEVSRACIGDILSTLEYHGRQHLLVYENGQSESDVVIRGLFSSTQIELQLGHSLTALPRARSFAEIEITLNS